MAELLCYQSLWATEQRCAGVAELPVPERFDRVKDAGYDGLAIDLGALDLPAAQSHVREYARTGLKGLVIAFPASIEALRPALHLAKDIGAPFVVVVGKVMPLAVEDMIPVVHLAPQMQSYVSRILERSDSFQGRIATRSQIQVPIGFAQHRVWLEIFLEWWKEGFSSWRMRAPNQDLVFLCELGPPNYAITDANGDELSDRWEEALLLRRLALKIWTEVADGAAQAAASQSLPIGGASPP